MHTIDLVFRQINVSLVQIMPNKIVMYQGHHIHIDKIFLKEWGIIIKDSQTGMAMGVVQVDILIVTNKIGLLF